MGLTAEVSGSPRALERLSWAKALSHCKYVTVFLSAARLSCDEFRKTFDDAEEAWYAGERRKSEGISEMGYMKSLASGYPGLIHNWEKGASELLTLSASTCQFSFLPRFSIKPQEEKDYPFNVPARVLCQFLAKGVRPVYDDSVLLSYTLKDVDLYLPCALAGMEDVVDVYAQHKDLAVYLRDKYEFPYKGRLLRILLVGALNGLPEGLTQRIAWNAGLKLPHGVDVAYEVILSRMEKMRQLHHSILMKSMDGVMYSPTSVGGSTFSSHARGEAGAVYSYFRDCMGHYVSRFLEEFERPQKERTFVYADYDFFVVECRPGEFNDIHARLVSVLSPFWGDSETGKTLADVIRKPKKHSVACRTYNYFKT